MRTEPAQKRKSLKFKVKFPIVDFETRIVYGKSVAFMYHYMNRYIKKCVFQQKTRSRVEAVYECALLCAVGKPQLPRGRRGCKSVLHSSSRKNEIGNGVEYTSGGPRCRITKSVSNEKISVYGPERILRSYRIRLKWILEFGDKI